MSNPVLGHGAYPTQTNRAAAAAFWGEAMYNLYWRKGEAVVTASVQDSASLSYWGNRIAERHGETLCIATRGYNTMTTRRYLGAVLEAVGWSIVALNGQSIALEGEPAWPTKTALKARLEAGTAVIVRDGMTLVPHKGRKGGAA